jgi:oligopeptidase A
VSRKQKQNNPLLDFSGLPRFNDIEPCHIEPAVDYMLDCNRNQISKLTASSVAPTWNNFMGPLEELSDRLQRLWAPVSHLNSVKNSEPLRQAYEACLPKMTEYESQLGQNRVLFEKISRMRNKPGFSRLNKAQRKSIDNALLDFKLSGVGLESADQDRFREISSKLSELGNTFSQNVLDATDAWTLHIENQGDLAGLPENVIALAKSRSEKQNRSGWTFGLQAPSFIPFMTYAENRDLRKEMYSAYVTRSSDLGPDAGSWENSGTIEKILQLRKEQAEILGFENYAIYSLQTKMAETPEEVALFLHNLADRCRDTAIAEVKELKDFGLNQFGLSNLEPWDYNWVSEKLRLHKYDISQETLRPYFPLPKVMEGMFDIANKLFGIIIRPKSIAQAWHPQTRFYEICDADGSARGYFYVDLFAREHKRGGAWMAECIGRRNTESGIQLPVAFLTCNFPEPVNGQPSLLSHDEVVTLFHEFGHGLHHLLTRVNISAVAGINGVPWDAVELPSQFLENWCWERQALDLISGHYKTGKPIPDGLLDKMRAAKNFQSAMQMLRQIEFSLFDLEIHRNQAGNCDIKKVRKILKRVRKQVSVIRTPDFNRFENTFDHIFSGGYAAGYYSYKWAEILSADAFGLFEEKGIFDSKTGQSFLKNILEKGGSEDPILLFSAFRGRKPEVNALLRHSGLRFDDIAA